MGESEAAKLQKHLNLLRQEYVKLQNKTLELEQKLALTSASSGAVNNDALICQLVKIANNLYEKEVYSDIKVVFSGKRFNGHKIILAARSSCWSERELADIDELVLQDVSAEVGTTLLKWVYTDTADIRNDESFIMDLVRAANRYKLTALRGRCEKMLMSSVSVSNCIRFYQTAEDIGAVELRKYCSEVIANHWDDLKTEDFVGMSANLLYDMFKAKSNYPLHLAIKHHREDIVFLYLIEYNLQLPDKLNEVDPQSNMTPIQVALIERQNEIAQTLVQHACDLNSTDINGMTLLHRFIQNGDDYAANFLIKNGANVKAVTYDKNESPLHLASSYKPPSNVSGNNIASGDDMAKIVRQLLDHDVNINSVDNEGRTALHRAISADNEEAFSVLLADKNIDLEIRDNNGHVVLWFAILSSKKPLQEDKTDSSYAARLVKQGSSADAINPLTGDSLLHMSAGLKNESAGLFLIEHGAHVDHTNKVGMSPLHVACQNGLVGLVNKLLQNGSNPNIQTTETEVLKTKSAARKLESEKKRKESRHRIIMLEKSKAMKKLKEIKESREKNLKEAEEQQTKSNSSPKSNNVDANPFLDGSEELDMNNPFNDDSVANPFLDGDEDANNPFLDNNDDQNFMEAQNNLSFFDEMQAASSAAMALTGNVYNSSSAVKTQGLPTNSNQTITTFDGRIDVQAITSPTQVESFNFDQMQISDIYILDGLHPDVIEQCWNKTPLHFAVGEKHIDVVKCFINQIDNRNHGGLGGRIQVVPDLNIIDSEGQSLLYVALLTKQFDMANLLIDGGADINSIDSQQLSLLHHMIMRKDIDATLFLLKTGVDIEIRSQENMTPLQMAIHLQLKPVVEALCKRGADVSTYDECGNTPLLIALKSQQADVAKILVDFGVDVNGWTSGVNGCLWTLLHRAIYENDEPTGCFLIRHGCDVNSPRKPGVTGDGGVEAWDGMTPLHLACSARQDQIVQCLVEYNANINAQDSEGRAPIHIAITTKNPIILSLLLTHPEVNFSLKDRLGQTPFVIAMNCRDHESSAAILAREPSAAEQFDNKGRNYLHLAVSSNNIDNVLFLISIEVNVNSRIQDGSNRTPMHLAIPTGNEIIVRHLILAGSEVNAFDKNRQTPLHIAAMEDKSNILEVLLQNNANPDLADANLNNALHLACQFGNLGAVRVLLTESTINAEAYNARYQNPLHVLACNSRENAAAIFEFFRQTMPNYPFDAFDGKGNTALFLAYTNGAVGLCCALLRAGARLGTMNKEGVSVFNAPVATNKLLYKLLDLLNAEPTWSDGPTCHECGQEFGVINRKHHCRHCGRLLCSKCSQQQMPILKYEITKPVRVCQVCFNFLTVGM